MTDKEAFKCENCGSSKYKQIDDDHIECEYCHTQYKIKRKTPKVSVNIGSFNASVDLGDKVTQAKAAIKRNSLSTARVAYAVASIAFGFIGVEYMMLGKVAKFVLSILFCWTGIPAIVGLVKGIACIFKSDEEFKEDISQKEDCWLNRLATKNEQ